MIAYNATAAVVLALGMISGCAIGIWIQLARIADALTKDKE